MRHHTLIAHTLHRAFTLSREACATAGAVAQDLSLLGLEVGTMATEVYPTLRHHASALLLLVAFLVEMPLLFLIVRFTLLFTFSECLSSHKLNTHSPPRDLSQTSPGFSTISQATLVHPIDMKSKSPHSPEFNTDDTSRWTISFSPYPISIAVPVLIPLLLILMLSFPLCLTKMMRRLVLLALLILCIFSTFVTLYSLLGDYDFVRSCTAAASLLTDVTLISMASGFLFLIILALEVLIY